MRENLYDAGSGTLLRKYGGGPGTTHGFVDDYAFFAQGLLDLYETGFDLAHLQWALALQETQNRLFAASGGGFFSVSGEDPSILLRIREDYDGAEPSANSIAALNLLRLAEMTGRPDFRDLAEDTLLSFAS